MYIIKLYIVLHDKHSADPYTLSKLVGNYDFAKYPIDMKERHDHDEWVKTYPFLTRHAVRIRLKQMKDYYAKLPVIRFGVVDFLPVNILWHEIIRLGD